MRKYSVIKTNINEIHTHGMSISNIKTIFFTFKTKNNECIVAYQHTYDWSEDGFNKVLNNFKKEYNVKATCLENLEIRCMSSFDVADEIAKMKLLHNVHIVSFKKLAKFIKNDEEYIYELKKSYSKKTTLKINKVFTITCVSYIIIFSLLLLMQVKFSCNLMTGIFGVMVIINDIALKINGFIISKKVEKEISAC